MIFSHVLYELSYLAGAAFPNKHSEPVARVPFIACGDLAFPLPARQPIKNPRCTGGAGEGASNGVAYRVTPLPWRPPKRPSPYSAHC